MLKEHNSSSRYMLNMNESWYRKCLPKVSEVKTALTELNCLRDIVGVKDIKIFGSLARNFNNESFRVKDVDLLIITPFHSEDLQAINIDILSMKMDTLEEEGYDVDAIKFSKSLVKHKELPIDHWVISSDKKLLHWGPVFDAEESKELEVEAEKFATKQTGFNLNRLSKSSDESRKNWYSSYHSYLQQQTEDMPSGWYITDCNDISNVLSEAIPLDK